MPPWRMRRWATGIVALENFNRLKAGGNLGEVDAETIGETEKQIVEIESTL